jgi:beta-mannosidase
MFMEDEEPRTVINLGGNDWLMEHFGPGFGEKDNIPEFYEELVQNVYCWNQATVPGDVYTDLYHAGEIEDPYFGRNEHKIKWVQDYEWWYSHGFKVPSNLKYKKLFINFEGIDYSCKVWLNGKYLGSHEGMMESFRFDVTDIAHITDDDAIFPDNLLLIKLDRPSRNMQMIAGLKNNFSGDYQTGLVPFGIWRDVKLIAVSNSLIENYRLETKLTTNLNDELIANVTVEGDYSTFIKEMNPTSCVVILKNKNQRYSKEIFLTEDNLDGKFACEITIENPKLWWPYELGNPNLYDLQIDLKLNNTICDSISDVVGLREIKMERNPGFSEEESEFDWTFVINNKKMFLRSACWGGQPSFLYGRNSREKYEHLLKLAKEANINNLRIFGWHPPETSDFYKICDELGITVWTNFPFATQVFSNEKKYLEKAYASSKAIVLERRNHPSTIMWMGGEEVFFNKAQSKSHNRELMEKIGDITRSLTNVPYRDASPLSAPSGINMGYKSKESIHANDHYYLSGHLFMEDYYPKLDYCIIPELTAASSPSIETLKKFIPKDELWPMGISWGYHGSNPDILQTLNYEVFGNLCNDNLEMFVEATQIAQGTIYQFALEHYRRCKPHISGVSFCHFITHWPLIKWEVVDYYGNPKISYQFVKRSYSPLLPSAKYLKRRYLPNSEFEAEIWILNDYYKNYKNMKIICQIIKIDNDENLDAFRFYESGLGKVVKEEIVNFDVDENVSKNISSIKWKVDGEIGDKFIVYLKLLDELGAEVADNSYTLLIDDINEAKKIGEKRYNEAVELTKRNGRGYHKYYLDNWDIS